MNSIEGRERTRFAAPFFISTNKTREARASLSASNDYRVEHHKIAYDKGSNIPRILQVILIVMLIVRLHASRFADQTTTKLQPMGAECPHVGRGYQMVV